MSSLTVRVKARTNPYSYMLDADDLHALLLDLARNRAASIEHNHAAGHYNRTSMAFVMMDPTADPWVPHHQAVLAALTIGDDATRFLPNAAAKAASHRRLNRNHGEAALTDPHLCGTGAFRYGHSANIRGQIVGASSQTPDQDLVEAAHLATDFVNAISTHHHTWQATTPQTYWFTKDTTPHQPYRDMVSFFTTEA
ncbi:hypothetical protein [Actinokineospora inagensis]|uniref:hypothetical protein n=1 Tax=Actinokineospora inagensis TaxID=103730 RepID=UPI0004141B54|nr:hypothetical protein [Actinokineospora inagensis]